MFSFQFENCILDYCVFQGTTLKKTPFLHCSLKEVDFSNADLTAAVFTECDLTNTHFHYTTLEKADFRTAKNFSIDPEINKLKKAKFAFLNLEGLLVKYQLEIE